jgi:hypothetical protein
MNIREKLNHRDVELMWTILGYKKEGKQKEADEESAAKRTATEKTLNDKLAAGVSMSMSMSRVEGLVCLSYSLY